MKNNRKFLICGIIMISILVLAGALFFKYKDNLNTQKHENLSDEKIEEKVDEKVENNNESSELYGFGIRQSNKEYYFGYNGSNIFIYRVSENKTYDFSDKNITDFKCKFSSDLTKTLCEKNPDLIFAINGDGKYELFSMSKMTFITQYKFDKMQEDSNGNFIASKDNDYYLINNLGEIIKEAKSGLILELDGNYLLLENNKLIYMDSMYRELSLSNIKTGTYKSSNYVWTNGYDLMIKNLNDIKNVTLGEDSVIKYTGNLSGEYIILYDCVENSDKTDGVLVYLIDKDSGKVTTSSDFLISTPGLF